MPLAFWEGPRNCPKFVDGPVAGFAKLRGGDDGRMRFAGDGIAVAYDSSVRHEGIITRKLGERILRVDSMSCRENGQMGA